MIKFLKALTSKGSLVRLSMSLGAALGIASLLIYSASENYWDRTIFRTQTVDFNLLSNIIHHKLSLHLINNDSEKIQKAIDSNYGLFGIIITDCKNDKQKCKGEKVLYLSGGKVEQDENGENRYVWKRNPRTWQETFSEEKLEGSLYLVLRNPPPLDPEWKFEHPHATEVTPLTHNNTGKIIGRAYLIRNPSPGFITDMERWLQSPFRTSASNLIYNSVMGATLFTGLLAWLIFEVLFYKKELAENKRQEAEKAKLEEAQKRLEAENKSLITTNKLQEAEQARLEAENRRLRIESLWDGFHESFDRDFTSVIANHLEELRGFFRRLKTDIDNVVHDFHKAPLLTFDKDVTQNIIEGFNNHPELIANLDRDQRKILIDKTTDFFRDTDKTIKSIKWVIDDLAQVANINSSNINIQETIQNFLNNQPPGAQSSGIQVNFHDEINKPAFILSNEWHLKSIIKNVLYNCKSALVKYELDLDDDVEFQGKIDIICSSDEKNAYITILDNGAGYPQEIMDKLYQSPNKVNPKSRNKRGMGSIIVYSYLNLHSGQVHIENKPEGGGKVTFSFPLVRDIDDSTES